MSGCLPGEIPCGLKASKLSQQTQKGEDCHAIAEQAVKLLFFMFYIFLLSTDQNTGGLAIIHKSASEEKVVLWLLMTKIKNNKNKSKKTV